MIELCKGEEEFTEFIARLYPELCNGNNLVVKNITFQVTDDCNLACTYCYQINKGHRRMSFETAKKFVDLLLSGDKGFKEYLGDDNIGVILEFIGGEPFLEVELIDQIMDYFRSETMRLNHPFKDKFRMSICSNGLLYNTPRVQKFLDKYHDMLSFNISIDGNKELHDSCRVTKEGHKPTYDIAMAGAKDWMSKGRPMSSKITVAPANVKYVYEASKHMLEQGYDKININCVYEEGWELEHATILYEQLKKFADYLLTLDHPENIYYRFFSVNDYKPAAFDEDKNWCGGDGQMLSCDPDGRLFPCIRYMESSLGDEREPICIGDVDNGIGKCASCQKCLKMLEGVTRRSQSTDECFNCPIGLGCGWCSGYNYQKFGTLQKRTTYTCNMHRAASLANVYYINKLNDKYGDKDRLKMYCPKEWAVPIIGEEEYEMLLALSTKEE